MYTDVTKLIEEYEAIPHGEKGFAAPERRVILQHGEFATSLKNGLAVLDGTASTVPYWLIPPSGPARRVYEADEYRNGKPAYYVHGNLSV